VENGGVVIAVACSPAKNAAERTWRCVQKKDESWSEALEQQWIWSGAVGTGRWPGAWR
jgi:hypothetical protein